MEFLNQARNKNSLAVHYWVRQWHWPLTSGLQKTKSSLKFLGLNEIFAKPKGATSGPAAEEWEGRAVFGEFVGIVSLLCTGDTTVDRQTQLCRVMKTDAGRITVGCDVLRWGSTVLTEAQRG